MKYFTFIEIILLFFIFIKENLYNKRNNK